MIALTDVWRPASRVRDHPPPGVQERLPRRRAYPGCTCYAVVITFKIVPDIRKGSGEVFAREGCVPDCWRSSVGRASDL